jgi:carbonic anhydrase/acetyltransferase-like protein (isoleucine patch superfamily)
VNAGKLGGVLIEHRGSIPEVDPSAYVAPTAVLCGAVRIRQSAWFGAHLSDRIIGGDAPRQ